MHFHGFTQKKDYMAFLANDIRFCHCLGCFVHILRNSIIFFDSIDQFRNETELSGATKFHFWCALNLRKWKFCGCHSFPFTLKVGKSLLICLFILRNRHINFVGDGLKVKVVRQTDFCLMRTMQLVFKRVTPQSHEKVRK